MLNTFKLWIINRRIAKLHQRIADELEAIQTMQWCADENLRKSVEQKMRRIEDMKREAGHLAGIAKGNPPYLRS